MFAWIQLIDPDTIEIVKTLPTDGDRIYALQVHPSDNSLAIGTRTGKILRVVLDK